MANHGGKRPKQYGTRKEREYADLLRSEGYKVERSGSSLGDFDLVALRTEGKCLHSLWIQVKAGQASYINACRRKWVCPAMPPFHIPRLACWIREERCWYEQDDNGESRRRERRKR